ncbi:hypothetical protein ACHAWX_003533 [Stephanocyclus meneghinianus]
MTASNNSATSTEMGEFSLISLSVDNKTVASSASPGAASLNATIDNITTSKNPSTLSSNETSETASTGIISASFVTYQITPHNSTLPASRTDLEILTSTSATVKFVTTSNPCSNDNPTWDSATQHCANSTTNFEYLFDGAFTTTVATATTTTTSDYSTERTLPTGSNEDEFPSSYSCTDESGPEEQGGGNTAGKNDSEREPVYLTFDYEIYTPPSPTEDMINATLSDFEKKLVNGVARALGLVDCSQKSSHGSVTRRVEDGSQKLRQRNYLRRSLQQKVVESTTNAVVEVSMKPMDLIDSTLCAYQDGIHFLFESQRILTLLPSLFPVFIAACTSQVILNDPNDCTPIKGLMTAWIEKEKARRISQLSVELNSEYQTPREFLLSTVQLYIEQNRTSYLTDDLLHVAYVGERNLEVNNTGPEVVVRPITPQADAEATNNLSSKYIGIGIASVFFTILLAGLVYSYYQNKQSESDLEESVEMDMVAGNYESDDDMERPEPSSKSSGSLKDEDGAFPSVSNMHSMMASDGGSIQDAPPKLLLRESDVSHDPSISTSLDPNIPLDDFIGLRGKVCSDAYPVEQQKNEDLNDSQAISPSTIMNNDNRDQNKDSYSSGHVSNEPLDAESDCKEHDLSPSAATEKMGNTGPFSEEGAHSANEDDEVSSLDSRENVDLEGLKQDFLPSLV